LAVGFFFSGYPIDLNLKLAVARSHAQAEKVLAKNMGYIFTATTEKDTKKLLAK
jgi:hypothetical protein